MASDLKLDLAMTASQRGPNVQLMGNPAVQEGATNCPPCECVCPHPLGAEPRITLPSSPCSAADSFCRSRGCNQSGDYRPSPLLHRRGARRASCMRQGSRGSALSAPSPAAAGASGATGAARARQSPCLVWLVGGVVLLLVAAGE